MTSPSISDRQQFISIWVMFGSSFLDNGSTNFETVHNFGKGGSGALVSAEYALVASYRETELMKFTCEYGRA